MNPNYLRRFLILTSMALATAGCDSDTAIDGLAISARCEPALQGELRLALSQPDGSFLEVQRTPLVNVCLPSTLTVEEYQPEQTVVSQWYQDGQLKGELVSKGGADIHAERAGGYRLLLAVSSQSPFLTNEAL